MAAAAAVGFTAAIPSRLDVCAPLTLTGHGTPGAAVVVDLFRGTWRSGVATTTVAAGGSWSVLVHDEECYAGSYPLRVRHGRQTLTGTVVRTGAAPSYTIAVSQPSHTGSGFLRGFGNLAVRGSVSAPYRTRVTLWRTDANRRNPQRVATTTTDAKGAYTFSTPLPTAANTNFFVDSGRGAAAQHSPYARVLVTTPAVGVRVPATMDVKATPTVSGTSSARGAARGVRLYVLEGRSWFLRGTTTTAADGSWKLSFTARKGYVGRLPVRAAMVLPDGHLQYSTTVNTTRTATLTPVVRATTAADISGSWHQGCPVGASGLRTITMNYIGYDHKVNRGVLIVRRDLSARVVAAFDRGLRGGFPIKRMTNPSAFGGNDVAMMQAGNTSAFNCRHVTGNPYAMSPHSYGKAIDVNTYENPYRDPQGRWYPNTKYATYRPASVAGLLTASSPLTLGLRGQGFAWFSGWDWQHFEA